MNIAFGKIYKTSYRLECKDILKACKMCGSINVIGVRTGQFKWSYECQSCGHGWSRLSLSKRLITLLFVIAAIPLGVYAIAFTNILGPIAIHVSPATGQYATLSLSSTPPSDVTVGQAVELTVNIQVQSGFTGVLEVNVTATDFTPAPGDVKVFARRDDILCGSGHGWYELTVSSISGGLKFRLPFQFQCSSGENGSFKVRLEFLKTNPTQTGNYEIRIGIVS